MGVYHPDRGFRSGSFASRSPRNYFAIFGVVYAVIRLGLSIAGYLAETGK